MSHDIISLYSRGDLLQRLDAALAEDGADPLRPTLDALAPYDQFHGRGLEATTEIAALVQPRPTDQILDIGSGIGGPARHFAAHFGCRVSGIDLTPEFCAVASHLSHRLGLAQKTDFHVGDALAEAGFEVLRLHSTLEQAREFGARSRAMVERGEKPPHRAVMLIHGNQAKLAMANMARGLSEGRVVPIEVLARNPGPA